MTDHAVLIAAAELLPALKSRLSADGRELLAFTDTEALRALEVITTRRPASVYLDRKFASTPRGTALMNRIKADPSLAETQIRVTAPDGADEPVPAASAAVPAPVAQASRVAQTASAPAARPGQELDYRGTRRVARHRISQDREILVDGNRGTIIDLSPLGAQLVTASILKPNQRVRVALSDDERPVRCSATVVWASFEIPKGASPRYRAGLEFIEPDTATLEAFIRRYSS